MQLSTMSAPVAVHADVPLVISETYTCTDTEDLRAFYKEAHAAGWTITSSAPVPEGGYSVTISMVVRP